MDIPVVPVVMKYFVEDIYRIQVQVRVPNGIPVSYQYTVKIRPDFKSWSIPNLS